jgi:hypothetical protein
MHSRGLVALVFQQLAALCACQAQEEWPTSLSLSGFACHPAANAEYTLQPEPVNGRPHYVAGAGGEGELNLYWRPSAPGWVVHARLIGYNEGDEFYSPDDAAVRPQNLACPPPKRPCGSSVFSKLP